MKCVRLWFFGKSCREEGDKGGKGREKTVVSNNCGREGPIPTRLEGMVVGRLLSCLGHIVVVGLIDRGYGREDWTKRV